MAVIVVLAGIATLFLLFFGVTWWTSHSKSYRAWETNLVQRAKEELASRPSPPWADDPIARSIEWTGTSAWGGEPGSNPKGAAVRIASVGADRIEFQPTSAGGWYGWMYFFAAVSFVLAYISTGSFPAALPIPLMCLAFGFVVWLARRLTRETLAFDKRLGIYWRGNEPPAEAAASSGQVGRISDIYALQLVGTTRYVGDPRMGVDSEHKESPTFELNLVLKDGTRLSTVCRDDYDGLDHDARILAAFLERPLWKPR